MLDIYFFTLNCMKNIQTFYQDTAVKLFTAQSNVFYLQTVNSPKIPQYNH